MPTKKDVWNALEKWTQKLQDPEVAKEFVNYNKTMQFTFPDIKVNIQMIFNGGKAILKEGISPTAEMSLEVPAELFIGIANGTIDPVEAFMEGTLKPKGNMNDLEKLQIFMDED